MKELFNRLPRISLEDRCDYLIDTCFFAWVFEHQKEHQLKELCLNKICAMTSFNAEETAHISHRIDNKTRELERRFLKTTNDLHVLKVPVHPGNRDDELRFVSTIVPDLICAEHDPSDAVILAAAVKTGANILTRDKHDLFNVKMENCVRKHRILVLNTFDRA
jgi:predicted nucleic acid-binding protein